MKYRHITIMIFNTSVMLLRIEGGSFGVICGVLRVFCFVKCFYTFKFPFNDQWLKGEQNNVTSLYPVFVNRVI